MLPVRLNRLGKGMGILRPILNKVYYKKETFLERRLPQAGEIAVKVGDAVRPFTVLGATFVSLKKQSWNFDSAKWKLRVTDGQRLGERTVVAAAKKPPFFKGDEVKTPVAGVVTVNSEGRFFSVTVSSLPEKFNLVAGVEARVTKVADRLSVLLVTEAYVVPGIFSSGREVIGEIKTVGGFDQPLTLSQLTPDLVGKIVVAGSFVSPEVVNKAQALGVTALVTGGVSLQVSASNFPLLVTEGFGRIPMNKKVWDFFVSEQLRTAVVEPHIKQVIVPSLDGDHHRFGPVKEPLAELVVGGRVQVFVWPNFGFGGEVLAIGQAGKRFPSGITDVGVQVKLETGEKIEVPVSNLGILE